MISKLTKLGEQALDVDRAIPSEDDQQSFAVLVHGERNREYTPRDLQFVEDYAFIENTAMRLRFQLTDSLKYLVYRIAYGDRDIALLMLAACRVLAQRFQTPILGVQHLLAHYQGELPDRAALLRITADQSNTSVLRDPSSWSV